MTKSRVVGVRVSINLSDATRGKERFPNQAKTRILSQDTKEHTLLLSA